MYEVSCCKLARYTRQGSKFLEMADKILNLSPVEEVLKQGLGKRSDVTGVLCYPVLSMFKVLLLQVWYSLSDRGIDEALFGQTSFRKFAGFSPMDNTPSHSTICRFRNNLINSGVDVILFKLINNYLEDNGLITKKGITIDSTIIKSSRRLRKIIDLSSQGTTRIVYSDDKDASWTIKANKYYYGYKLHMITDINHGFIIAGKITPANCADTTEIIPIIKSTPLEKKSSGSS